MILLQDGGPDIPMEQQEGRNPGDDHHVQLVFFPLGIQLLIIHTDCQGTAEKSRKILPTKTPGHIGNDLVESHELLDERHGETGRHPVHILPQPVRINLTGGVGRMAISHQPEQCLQTHTLAHILQTKQMVVNLHGPCEISQRLIVLWALHPTNQILFFFLDVLGFFPVQTVIGWIVQ